MSDASRRLHCTRHGATPATFVCEHIGSGAGCGFHTSEDPDDAWPDAWCDACQAALGLHGGWDESNEPKVSLLCTGCYETARTKNRYVPAPLVPGQLSVSDEEYAALARACFDRVQDRQEAVDRRWRFIGRARWEYDDGGSILRLFNDGEPGVVATARPVGSFSTKTETWMWTWANEQYSEAERADAAQVRTFGEIRGIRRLHDPHWSCTEDDAWEVAQIAADLLDAQVIYRAPFDHVRVFFLLSDFRDAGAA